MTPPQCITQSDCHSFELILTSCFKAGTNQRTQEVKSSSATCSLSPQMSPVCKSKLIKVRGKQVKKKKKKKKEMLFEMETFINVPEMTVLSYCAMEKKTNQPTKHKTHKPSQPTDQKPNTHTYAQTNGKKTKPKYQEWGSLNKIFIYIWKTMNRSMSFRNNASSLQNTCFACQVLDLQNKMQ